MVFLIFLKLLFILEVWIYSDDDSGDGFILGLKFFWVFVLVNKNEEYNVSFLRLGLSFFFLGNLVFFRIKY